MSGRGQHPLLKALGGVLGIVEAVVPASIFVVILAITAKQPGLPYLAMIVSGVAALVFIVIRIVRRENLTQALAGLLTVVASFLLAVFTNRAENNFVIGIWTNAAYGLAFTISALVGWPLIGVAIGLFTKQGHDWRRTPHQRKILTRLTWMWVGMFALRLAIEIPLYSSANIDGLAIAKLVLGMPLYAPVVVVTWLFVRGMFDEESLDENSESSPA